MNRATEFLTANWFSLFLFVLALTSGAMLLFLRQRRRNWSLGLILLGSLLAAAAVGGLVLPFEWGLWLSAAVLGVLFIMLLVVIITGAWSAPVGYTAGALL